LAALQQIILAESKMGHGEENVLHLQKTFSFKTEHVGGIKGNLRRKDTEPKSTLWAVEEIISGELRMFHCVIAMEKTRKFLI